MVDNRSPEAGVDVDRLSLSRRELLVGAGGVLLAGGLAACGSSGSSSSAASGGGSTPGRDAQEGRQLPPRRHGRRRERHHRRPEHRHQARPGPPDRQLGDAPDLRRGLRPRARTAWPRRSTPRCPSRSTCALRVGHRVPQRQDAHGRRRHLLDQAHPEPEGRALRRCRARLDRSEQAHRRWTPTRCGSSLKQPDSTIPDQLGQYFNGIVPVGYERKGAARSGSAPGPYKIQSFTPGQQSVAVRNENYWRTGLRGRTSTRSRSSTSPTPTAQVNALLAGQVDAITDIPFAQIDAAKAQRRPRDPRGAQGGGWLPLCMAIDMDAVHRRQASARRSG